MAWKGMAACRGRVGRGPGQRPGPPPFPPGKGRGSIEGWSCGPLACTETKPCVGGRPGPLGPRAGGKGGLGPAYGPVYLIEEPLELALQGLYVFPEGFLLPLGIVELHGQPEGGLHHGVEGGELGVAPLPLDVV